MTTKTLKDCMREEFGTEEEIFRFYILGQEETSIKGVKKWLMQKRDLTTEQFFFRQELLEDLEK